MKISSGFLRLLLLLVHLQVAGLGLLEMGKGSIGVEGSYLGDHVQLKGLELSQHLGDLPHHILLQGSVHLPLEFLMAPFPDGEPLEADLSIRLH